MRIALCKNSISGPISGADETLVTYAIRLRESGWPVEVVLLFPFPRDDPYHRRLCQARVPVTVIAERARLLRALKFMRRSLLHFFLIFILIPRYPAQARKLWQALMRYLSLLEYLPSVAFFRNKRYDLLHVFTPDTGAMVLIRAGHACGIPVLYQELGTPEPVAAGLDESYRQLARVTPLCDSVAALSPTLARQWTDWSGKDGLKFGVLPLIVEEPPVLSLPRRQLPVSVIFGFASRIEPGKGPLKLLAAFAELKQSFSGAYLRMAGDGPEYHEALKVSRRLGLAEDCEFTGMYWEPAARAAFMQSLDVFVLPTLAEGTPNCIIEAMAAGLPVISTTVGGIPDIISEETGILVPPRNRGALSQAMRRLAVDPDLRARMGHAGRERYRNLFSPEAVLPRLKEFYSSIATRRAANSVAANSDRRLAQADILESYGAD